MLRSSDSTVFISHARPLYLLVTWQEGRERSCGFPCPFLVLPCVIPGLSGGFKQGLLGTGRR